MLLPRKNAMDRIAKLTHWLATVAMAAPAVPISNVKMKSGSSAMLISPPEQRPIMDTTAAPSALKMQFRTNEQHMMGAPMRMIRPYAHACGSIVSVAPSARMRGSRKRSPKMSIRRPPTSSAKKPLDA